MTPARVRAAALVANALFASTVLFLPWYALGDYVPNGWDATWLARLALVAAVAAALAMRAGAPTRLVAGLSLLAFALVAVRVALPPDFGFGFDGLDVPVDRRVGCWVALATALAALLAALAADRARTSPEPASAQPA